MLTGTIADAARPAGFPVGMSRVVISATGPGMPRNATFMRVARSDGAGVIEEGAELTLATRRKRKRRRTVRFPVRTFALSGDHRCGL